MKKYVLQVTSSNNLNVSIFDNNLHYFWNSVLRLPYHKEGHKLEFGTLYFKGMGENWFPLILLGLYDLLVAESRIEEAKKVIDYFKVLSNNSDNHSFYIDNAM